MNYITPEQIKEYVSNNPTGIAGNSKELSEMVNHFAELIVAECVDIADDYDGVGSTIVSRIKQHFGIEPGVEI